MRRLIPRLPLAGLLAVGTFVVLAVSLLSPSKAEAWWPPGPCYAPVNGAPTGTFVYEWVTPCGPSHKEVTAVWSGGFSSGVGVMAPNGTITLNGTVYSGCYISSAPTLGAVNNGFWVPSGAVVVGLRDCLTGVTLTAPPGWAWPIWPQPVPQPQPQCGSWNNWCQPVPQAPVYPTPPGSVLTVSVVSSWCGNCNGNFRTQWEGNYTIIVYSGVVANFNVPAGVNYDYWNGYSTISGSGPTSFWAGAVTFRLPR